MNYTFWIGQIGASPVVMVEPPIDVDNEGEALEISIAKWTFIATYIERHRKIPLDGADETCGLCAMYLSPNSNNPCRGCPIARHTGDSMCHQTPYQAYVNARSSNEALTAAREEIEFLESLRAEICSAKSK